MPRTLPSAIEQHLTRDGAIVGAIVKLTDGVSTWYLGTQSMPEFSEGHVYPILDDKFSVAEGVSIFTKQWQVSNVTVNILNGQYKKDASFDWMKFCNEIGDLINTTADLYFFAGPNVTQISDCLHRFSGKIIKHPTYDSEKVVLEIVDKWVVSDKLIPSTRLVSVYPDSPQHVVNQMIPLVYGQFTANLFSLTGTGLIKGFPTEAGEKPLFVLADHIMESFTFPGDYLYAPQIGLTLPRHASADLSEDDSGRGTAQGTGDSLIYFVKAVGDDKYGYAATVLNVNDPTDPENIYDNDSSTYGTINDNNFDTGATQGGIGWVTFDQEDEFAVVSIMRDNAQNGFVDTEVLMFYKGDNVLAPLAGYPVIRLFFSTTDFLEQVCTLDATVRFETEDMLEADQAAKDERFMMFIETRHSGGDSVVDNDALANLYLLYFAVRWYFRGDEGTYNTPLDGQSNVINTEYCWVSGVGRLYGSWITDGGRSVGGLVPGIPILNPEFIIESLLRDEQGFTTSDIDTDSFDDASNSSVVARLNQIEQENIFTVIRRLAEQSTFAFFIDGASLARLIPLNDKTPTTDVTIPASHLIAKGDGSPDIKVSKTTVYCNSAEIYSKWQGEYGLFRDYDLEENASSKTTNGIREGTFNWPNICDTSSDHVAGHLVSDADGIWSNPHVQIEIKTKALMYSHLEVGNYIELDDTSIDPHILCYGASWSGKQFLVVEVKQNGLRETLIKAIELY